MVNIEPVTQEKRSLHDIYGIEEEGTVTNTSSTPISMFESEPVSQVTEKPTEVIASKSSSQGKVFIKKKITLNTNIFSNLFQGTKNMMQKITSRGSDMSVISMNVEEKAEHYIKKCWNHMSRNEVDDAKKSYETLRDVYEKLPEGPKKIEVYHEVVDIFQRLS